MSIITLYSTEKSEIIALMKIEMKLLGKRLTTGSLELENFDEEMDFCTREAEDYIDIINFYKDLYNESSDIKKFWHLSSGTRGIIFQNLQEYLSPPLYAKIVKDI